MSLATIHLLNSLGLDAWSLYGLFCLFLGTVCVRLFNRR